MSGDTRRETRRLANRWHGAKKSPKEKVSRLEVRTGVRLDWEFDDPIGVLKDCHRKIRRSLHVLWVIADRAAGRELTSDEIAAVRSAMNCLRVDGSRHTADEEQSLFPRLRAQTISGDSEDLIALEVNRRQTDRLSAMVEAFYST
jgi:hemerythrin-like domain-containing protein